MIKLRGGDSAGPKREPQGLQNLPNHRSFFFFQGILGAFTDIDLPLDTLLKTPNPHLERFIDEEQVRCA